MKSMRDWPVSNARRLEIYVRWSLYLVLLWMPAQFLVLLPSAVRNQADFDVPRLVVLVLLSLPLTMCNVLVARWCLDRVMRGPAPVPRWFVALWLSLVVTLTLVIATQPVPGWMLLLGFPWACAAAAVTPLLSARTTGLISVGAIVIGVVLAVFGFGTSSAFLLLLFLFLIWTAWATGWMLRVLRELQRAHETAAQLALAEERLRISRDLHDVFGRTLATISVKSELAAELSRRGHHDRAAAEMAQIRRIANTAGTEVRRVVRDERRVSWTDEVDGARALLNSAGIRCAVSVDDVPEAYAEPLAWVIREGVTNVLRHSRATQMTISAASDTEEVVLTLANNGAGEPRSATTSTGTGLGSMAERVRAVGGALKHQIDGDWFILTASIPTVQEHARDTRLAG